MVNFGNLSNAHIHNVPGSSDQLTPAITSYTSTSYTSTSYTVPVTGGAAITKT